MRVALISGLWPSEDLNGLIDLRFKIAGIKGVSDFRDFKYDSKILTQFDVVIAHSFGANPAEKLDCKYLALIEPVRFWWSQKEWRPVRANVDCFLRKGWRLPPSVPPEFGRTFNIKGLDHANAPRNEFIQQTILTAIDAMQRN